MPQSILDVESAREAGKNVGATKSVVFSTGCCEGNSLFCNTPLQYLRRNIGAVQVGSFTTFQAK
jgi:hypothetical protein